MKRVYCIHPGIHDIESLIEYLGIEKEVSETLVWEPNNPDYLFVAEHIFFVPQFFYEFKKYIDRDEIIKIYISGECISPDMNLFDYAIAFDRKLKDSDRICRFPPTVLHRESIFVPRNDLSRRDAEQLINNRKKFCCFIYSNPYAHPMRDRLFYELSRYKRIDSLGRHLHNTDTPSSRNAANWRELSVKMKSDYKFSIASENASYEGYTSEKLFSSFQAHTVPIYWGNPFVSEEFNNRAFIDCNKLDSMEEIVQRVKAIDEDDEMWIDMVLQPWQTVEQELKTEQEVQEYYSFINHIFKQDIQDAHRIPTGTYPSKYREFFKRNPSLSVTIRNSQLMDCFDKVKKPFVKPAKTVLNAFRRLQ